MNKLKLRDKEIIEPTQYPVVHKFQNITESQAKSWTLIIVFFFIAVLTLINMLSQDVALLSSLMILGGISLGFGGLVWRASGNLLASIISAICFGFFLSATGVAGNAIHNLSLLFAALQRTSGAIILLITAFIGGILLRERL
jgi:hypothetical protein